MNIEDYDMVVGDRITGLYCYMNHDNKIVKTIKMIDTGGI